MGLTLPSDVSLSGPGMRLLDTAWKPQQRGAGVASWGQSRTHPAFVHCAVSSAFTSALQRTLGMGGIRDSIMVDMRHFL